MGKRLSVAFAAGNTFPEELGQYRLVIHCGGCMRNERAVQARRLLA